MQTKKSKQKNPNKTKKTWKTRNTSKNNKPNQKHKPQTNEWTNKKPNNKIEQKKFPHLSTGKCHHRHWLPHTRHTQQQFSYLNWIHRLSCVWKLNQNVPFQVVSSAEVSDTWLEHSHWLEHVVCLENGLVDILTPTNGLSCKQAPAGQSSRGFKSFHYLWYVFPKRLGFLNSLLEGAEQ